MEILLLINYMYFDPEGLKNKTPFWFCMTTLSTASNKKYDVQAVMSLPNSEYKQITDWHFWQRFLTWMTLD